MLPKDQMIQISCLGEKIIFEAIEAPVKLSYLYFNKQNFSHC